MQLFSFHEIIFNDFFCDFFIYENSFAVSSELFKVLPKEEVTIQKVVKSNIALVAVFVVFAGLLFLFAYLMLPKIKIFKKIRFKKMAKKVRKHKKM